MDFLSLKGLANIFPFYHYYVCLKLIPQSFPSITLVSLLLFIIHFAFLKIELNHFIHLRATVSLFSLPTESSFKWLDLPHQGLENINQFTFLALFSSINGFYFCTLTTLYVPTTLNHCCCCCFFPVGFSKLMLCDSAMNNYIYIIWTMNSVIKRKKEVWICMFIGKEVGAWRRAKHSLCITVNM